VGPASNGGADITSYRVVGVPSIPGLPNITAGGDLGLLLDGGRVRVGEAWGSSRVEGYCEEAGQTQSKPPKVLKLRKGWLALQVMTAVHLAPRLLQRLFTFPTGSYQPGLTYTFYAFATNLVGEGPPSAPFSQTAPAR